LAKLSPYQIFHRDWTIIGSFAFCYTFQPAITWLANGVVDIAPLISHTLPLADFPAAFASFADGKTPSPSATGRRLVPETKQHNQRFDLHIERRSSLRSTFIWTFRLRLPP
jgi:hypothetical protein